MTRAAASAGSGLAALLARDWLLVGVGNDLRGDDGFGPHLARRLAAAGFPALDGGVALEALTGRILARGPEVLFLADCADHGGSAGSVVLRPARGGESEGPSTHDPGLGLLLLYLGARLPGLAAWLLGVQPERMGFGDAMSGAVRRAVRRVERAVRWAARRDRQPPRERV